VLALLFALYHSSYNSLQKCKWSGFVVCWKCHTSA